MMHKRIILALAALLATTALSAQAVVKVVPRLGSPTTFTFSGDYGGIYFDTTFLMVITEGEGHSFVIDDVRCVDLTEATGIHIVPADAPNPISVSPNPATGHVELAGVGAEAVLVEVFNTAGQRVLTARAADGTRVDISDLPGGTYVIRAADRIARFVKQ